MSMNRRQFLKGAALGAVALSTMGIPAVAEEKAAEVKTPLNPEYDLYNPPIVETPKGKLRGYMNDGIFSFAGITYATAARFEQPKPVEAWEGVKDAQTYGCVCPIAKMTAVGSDEFVWPHRYWVESEDCQNLNVWTKTIDKNAKQPVMVFLHGGAFSNGSSIEAYAYDGRNLAEWGDVVVVTLNHRLNVIGCLNLSAYGEQYANSGNTGMADIEMALRWVQENIECFGGDPGNVTIFGQSGGSGKVVTLMHMPSAKGLFHKAIAESSGSASMIYANESPRITEILLENLGIDGTQIDVLKEMDFYTLLDEANKALAQAKKEFGRNISWRPLEDDVYCTADWAEWAADVPFIAGTCFSERSSTIARGDGSKNEWSEEEIEANLKELYGDNAAAIKEEFARLFPEKKIQDAYFYAPSYRNTVRGALAKRAPAAKAPIYNYLFAYEAPVNGGITPFHCAELSYVFHNVGFKPVSIATGISENSFKVQDAVAGAWVAFARTGNPSQEGLEWKPYNAETQTGTMIFDIESRFAELDDQKMVDLMG